MAIAYHVAHPKANGATTKTRSTAKPRHSSAKAQVPKRATSRGDVNIALRRDLSNVTLSGHPQVCDLTCERIEDRKRIEDRERIVDRVEQWLQLGNNRGGFCPSKRIKNLTHGAGAGRESARQLTEPGVRVGGLEHQEERCRSQGSQDRVRALRRRLRGLS